MMIRPILITLIFFSALPSIAFGQYTNQKIDSLLVLLKKDKPDTNKLNHLHALCQEYFWADEHDVALKYSAEGLSLAERLPNDLGIAKKRLLSRSYNSTGIISAAEGENAKALEYHLKALSINEELRDEAAIAKSLSNIGIVYNNAQDYLKAIEYYQRSLKMDEANNRIEGIEACLANIGTTYSSMGEYEKALDYLLRALKLAEDLKNDHLQRITIDNIAIAYREQKNFSGSLEYELRSLVIYKRLVNKEMIGQTMSEIVSLYADLNDYEAAEKFLLSSMKYCDSIDYYGKARFHYQLCSLYYQGKIKSTSSQAICQGHILSGKVESCKTRKPIKGVVMHLIGSDGSNENIRTDSAGRYSFNEKKGVPYIKPGRSYVLLAEAPETSFMNSYDKFKLVASKDTLGQTYVKDFCLEWSSCTFYFPTLHFVKDSVLPLNVSKEDIATCLQMLRDNPLTVVEIGGHCSDDEKNADKLAAKRAAMVQKEFVKYGIAQARVVPKGYGTNKPYVESEEDQTIIYDDEYIATLPLKEQEAARAKNRRVSFRVIEFNYKGK